MTDKEQSLVERLPNLKERALQFTLLQLPGQPQGMHMGTSYLVSDLLKFATEAADFIARLTAPVETRPLAFDAPSPRRGAAHGDTAGLGAGIFGERPVPTPVAPETEDEPEREAHDRIGELFSTPVAPETGGELLPCPFCGSHAKLFAVAARRMAMDCPDAVVECAECHVDICKDTDAEAVEAWNRRTQAATIADLKRERDEARELMRGAMDERDAAQGHYAGLKREKAETQDEVTKLCGELAEEMFLRKKAEAALATDAEAGDSLAEPG
jgi:hypothetical protein